jgi:ankyrin repeat protein
MSKVAPSSNAGNMNLAKRVEKLTLSNRWHGLDVNILSAISSNNIREVSRILHIDGFDINKLIYHNATDKRRFGYMVSPLSYAIHKGIKKDNSDIVEFLLENGANPNLRITNDGGGDPEYAIFIPMTDNYKPDQPVRLKIMKLLVKYGADLNVTVNNTPFHNHQENLTPLQLAEKYELQEFITYLRSLNKVTVRAVNAPQAQNTTLPGAVPNSPKGGRRNKKTRKVRRSKRKTRSHK